MTRAVFLAVTWLLTMTASAQIPYYANTVGNGKLYGYSSLSVRPGINRQGTYTTFQYGIGDHLTTGIDLRTIPDCAYWGALIRYGLPICQWFNLGAAVTPSFDLNHHFKFSYLISALYLNGAISKNGHLFWCTNTWWTVNKGAAAEYSNYEYLGYTISMKKHYAITPMIGATHSWKFNQDATIDTGFYITYKSWNLYLWADDILDAHPRYIIGLDFAL